MNKEVLNPKEIFESYVSGAELKKQYSFKKTVFLGMMAGAFIALGAEASNMACHTVSNVGLARLVAGVVFPVGLMMIIFVGGELFTGDCLLFMAKMDHKIKLSTVIKILTTVFVANLCGAVLISILVSLSGQWDYSGGGLGAYTLKVAISKSQISVMSAIASGILCNILVCVAVLMATSASTGIAKIFSIFFTIMAFVVSGFEHCVANMYYLSAGLLATLNPLYVSQAQAMYGVSQLDIAGVLNNLLFVTIGNIIGGLIVTFVVHTVRKK